MKHICGFCNKEFKSEEAYLKHTCKVTGLKPTKPEHVNFVKKEPEE
jgi:hypothetical protein